MILYLSRNESASLLDTAARENGLHIRKVTGNFNLAEFIVKEMRKYASSQYFCVERSAVIEKDDKFLEALNSFQMMYSARIIVIHENLGETDSLMRGLVQIGVTDIVTATDTDEITEQIAECLSDEGMQRFKPTAVRVQDYGDESNDEYEERETLGQSVTQKAMDDEQYRFDCLNIKIGVIGSTRRVGTTTAALGLANFIKNHGGTVCYMAFNTNRHLESIANACNFDTEDDFYTFDAIDFYENVIPKHDYNFIITDYGDIKRETVRKYKDSDIYLLCGASSKQFEVVEFAEALKQIRSVNPQILTYAPASDVATLFSTAVTKEPAIIKPVWNMLDYNINGIAFKRIIQEYIVETSKRL